MQDIRKKKTKRDKESLRLKKLIAIRDKKAEQKRKLENLVGYLDEAIMKLKEELGWFD
jgi:hypothetical protein